MTFGARKEYLEAIRLRYGQAKKSERTEILNEFCLVCEYSRKHAIRVLSGKRAGRKNSPGPKVKYTDDFIIHLAHLWKAMGNICSKKMVAAIPLWLPYYRHPSLTEHYRQLLLQISSASIDRCLKKFKEQRGLSGTVASFFKNKIPLKLLEEDQLKRPGFMEMDTVAHCGTSLAGNFVWTLTMTDLFSGWTENRAVWTKDSYKVMLAIMGIEDRLPFYLRGVASDNGTEFLNENVLLYFSNRSSGAVEFVRRRPYQKNDNAYVEQKNWTHVRGIFGYERIDQLQLVEVMNEIYKTYWNPLQNFFTPCLKLKSKKRVGGKIIKKYDEAKTPYQRLMDSKKLTLEQEDRLRKEFESLNPFKVRKLLDDKLSQFFRIMDTGRRKVI